MKKIALIAFALMTLASFGAAAQNGAGAKASAARLVAMLADPAVRRTAPLSTPVAFNCTKNSECETECCCNIAGSKACYAKTDCSNSGGSC